MGCKPRKNPPGIETTRRDRRLSSSRSVASHEKTRQGLKHPGYGRKDAVTGYVASHEKTRQGLKRGSIPSRMNIIINVASHEKTRQGLKQFDNDLELFNVLQATKKPARD